MSGRDLLQSRPFKTLRPSQIENITSLSRSRISELLSEKTLVDKLEISSKYLKAACENSDITPEELYEAVAEKKYSVAQVKDAPVSGEYLQARLVEQYQINKNLTEIILQLTRNRQQEKTLEGPDLKQSCGPSG